MRRGNCWLVLLIAGLFMLCSWAAAAEQDWGAIEAAAREEGKVVIYSVSSRMGNIVDEFMAKYGVEIEWYDLASDDQIEKFSRECDAGVYVVDVLYGNNDAALLNEFLPEGKVVPFIPDTTAPFLDQNEKEPFLVQRWTSRVLIYNAAFNPDGPPIDSLWDLTREEWAGKVVHPDPLSGQQGAVYQTILQHPEEMAAAYEREFGEAITLSAGINNAAEEWFLRFIQNDPVIGSSTSKIAKGVGDVIQSDLPAPIGWTTFSKLRKYGSNYPCDPDYAAAPLYDLDPVFGVAYPTILALSAKAPHPNAGKLLIRYLVETGLWPWNEIGDYAAREDIEALQVHFFNEPPFAEVKLWVTDPDHVYNTAYDYVEFYLSISP